MCLTSTNEVPAMPQVETRYIQLNYAKDGKVTVTSHDEDRFIVTIQEAVVACRDAEKILEYRRQFVDGLVPKLKHWLEARGKKVRKAFLTIRDSGLLFLVVRQEAACDGEFTDALTSLEVDVANDPALSMIRMDTLALPDVSDEGLKSFLNPVRVKELADAQ
jgi:hypothetical protein